MKKRKQLMETDFKPVKKDEPKDILQIVSVIKESLLEGMHCYVTIGVHLNEIITRALWRDVGPFKDQWEFFEETFGLSKSQAYRFIAGSDAYVAMQRHVPEALDMPQNEYQIRPLLKMEPMMAAKAWEKVLKFSKDRQEPITAKMVEQVVSQKEPIDIQAVSTPEVDQAKEPYGLTGDDAKATERGEEQKNGDEEDTRWSLFPDKCVPALHRIGKLLGEKDLEALLNENVKIPSQDIAAWGRVEGDEEFKAIGRLLIGSRWDFKVAKKFVSSKITNTTNLEEMMNHVISSRKDIDHTFGPNGEWRLLLSYAENDIS